MTKYLNYLRVFLALKETIDQVFDYFQEDIEIRIESIKTELLNSDKVLNNEILNLNKKLKK